MKKTLSLIVLLAFVGGMVLTGCSKSEPTPPAPPKPPEAPAVPAK